MVFSSFFVGFVLEIVFKKFFFVIINIFCLHYNHFRKEERKRERKKTAFVFAQWCGLFAICRLDVETLHADSRRVSIDSSIHVSIWEIENYCNRLPLISVSDFMNFFLFGFSIRLSPHWFPVPVIVVIIHGKGAFRVVKRHLSAARGTSC